MANVVITGAARGIGFELVKQSAAAGDRVFALVRDLSGATALQSVTDAAQVSVHEADVSSDDSVRAAAAAIGSEPIDVIYNVAGVLGPVKPELDLGSSDWAAWTEVLNVMTYGPLRVLQAFLPQLREGSKVVSLTSQLAASTWPYGGLYPYVAAKAALNRVMRSAAFDLRDRGIVVGVVHPGYVQTDMGGPNADITPQESARGIRETTAAWTIADTGAFLKWNGEPHDW